MAHKFMIEQNKADEYVRQVQIQQRNDLLARRLFQQGRAKNAIESVLKNGPKAPIEAADGPVRRVTNRI